jgi:predicted component of type VI protein secretion system
MTKKTLLEKRKELQSLKKFIKCKRRTSTQLQGLMNRESLIRSDLQSKTVKKG